MLRMFDVLDVLQSAPGYDEMCRQGVYFDTARNETTCEILAPTRFWNNSRSVFLDAVETDQDVIDALSNSVTTDGMPFPHSLVFGNTETSANIMTSAQSAFLYLGYADTGEGKDQWEKEALASLLDLKDELLEESSVNINLLADGSLEDEFVRAIMEDIPLAVGVFVIMATFTALIFTDFRHPEKSRTLLGLAAVVSVLLSLCCGFGVLFMFGVPFTTLTQLVPFMVVGVGLDDSFIIMGSFDRMGGKLTVVERIEATTNDIGISVVTTTLTSALAFGLGCISSVPAVFWLCQYCCPTIILVLIFQLTFFIACVALDAKRKERHSSDKEGPPLRQETTATSYAMERYAKILLKPLSKTLVVGAFLGLFGVSCVSIYGMKQEFSVSDILPKVSYVTDYLDNTRLFFESEFTGVDLFFRDVDPSDPTIREQMRNYTKAFSELDIFVQQTGKPFWLDALDLFLLFRPDADSKTFEENVDLFLSDPIYNALYGRDIVRNEHGQVVVSRTSIALRINIDDVHEQIRTLELQRQITDAQEINQGSGEVKFFAYAEVFNVFEFYARAVHELTLTTALGVAAVSLVAALFIPHYSSVLFTFPLVCLSYADLLGFMRWCGVSINALSYVCLTLSIGLMVDFLMHVLIRYFEVKGSRRERTVELLRTMGSSIIQGGSTTFMGIMLLAFSSSAAFRTIFVIFIGIVVLGVGHGLILLPVVLDCIGPEDIGNNDVPTRGGNELASVEVADKTDENAESLA